jgi:soluble lytic murein transglycosylase-like protein
MIWRIMQPLTLIAMIGIGAGLYFMTKETKAAIPEQRALPGIPSKPYTPVAPVYYDDNSFIPTATDNAGQFNPQATANSEPAPLWQTPINGQQFENDFIAASQYHGLPAGLLSRVAYQESRYNPDAYNPSGASGIMQIIPKWHPGVDVWNPTEAIWYAAKYLRQLYNQFGSWTYALAAYNWGPGNLSRKGIDNAPLETRNYIAEITRDTGVS